MLDKIKERNSKIIVDHFNEVFKGEYTTQCEWGFPALIIMFNSSKGDLNNSWRITLDVLTTAFSVDCKAFRVVDEKEISEWSGINSQTLAFIIQETLKISKQIFSVEETTELAQDTKSE